MEPRDFLPRFVRSGLGVALVLTQLGQLVAARVAHADERPSGGTPDPSTLPAPTPPGTPGTTTVVAPPGSGGVTVVAPTPGGGQVTASGCSTVVVQGQPTSVTPAGAPCPTLAPYQPYQPYPAAYPPAAQYPAPYYEVRSRYARDPDRTAALIGASVGFGVGAALTGIVYLVQNAKENDTCGRVRTTSWSDGVAREEVDNSGCGSARTSLIAYGAIVSFVPSLPRFVVGDSSKGLLFTGLRAASFATAALVDWGDDGDTKWQGPFLLGFAAPITLGIIDLATTPHREDLEPEQAKAGVKGVSPIAVTDRAGRTHGGVLTLSGIF